MTIEFERLTKRYRATLAVDEVSCTVPAGAVTGLLGPNGAGKSTAMRVLAGLERPTAGRVSIAGRAYGERLAPLHEVGVMLDGVGVHPGRRCVEHLRWMAAANRIAARRVAEVLEATGLAGLDRRRGRELSLGMRQRLALACALLGDPAVLVLDEPADGLDPGGIAWLRTLLADLARQGRTVLVSSHLLGEIARYADRLVLLDRGRMIANLPAGRLAEHPAAPTITQVRTWEPDRCAAALSARPGAQVTATEDPALLEVRGLSAQQTLEACTALGLPVQADQRPPTLEEFYLALTAQPEPPTAAADRTRDGERG